MKNLKKLIALTIILTQFSWGINSYADTNVLPSAPVTQDGSALVVTPSGSNDVVFTAAGRGISEFQSHDIGSVNKVTYDLNGAYLSRVVGGNPTTIWGKLDVNGGQLFLINTSGITFASGSQVNPTGLVASSLDIGNTAFMNSKGSYNFSNSSGGNSGSVINQGTINAPGGFVALLGPHVENDGVITANAGQVLLASGNAITVNLDPTGIISAVVGTADNSSSQTGVGIVNTKTITATGGQVILTAQSLGGIVKNLVNNTGVIEANGVTVNSQGDVVLGGGEITAGNGGVNVTASGAVNIHNTNINTLSNYPVITSSFNEPNPVSTSTAPATGGINITGDSVTINTATLDAVGWNGPVAIHIHSTGTGTTINNSQVLALSEETTNALVPNNGATINVDGVGLIQSTNSSFQSNVDSNANNPQFVTNGSSVNINSTADSNGISGVNLSNTLVQSDVNGASGTATNTISAPIDNSQSGGVNLTNDTRINTTQNTTISGESITGDSTSSINSSGQLDLTAIRDIGSLTSPLNLGGSNVTASSTGGNIYLNGEQALNLTGFDAAFGLIDVTANGGIDAGTISAEGVTLNAQGDINLNGEIGVGNGGLNVTAGGAVNVNHIFINALTNYPVITSSFNEPNPVSLSTTPATGGINLTGNSVAVNGSTLTAVGFNGPIAVNINSTGSGVAFNNSQIYSLSEETTNALVPNNGATINVTGKGVIQLTGTSFHALVDSNANNPQFVTNGSSVNINSTADSNGNSGVHLSNTLIESNVNGASGTATNTISAPTGNLQTGGIHLTNGTRVNTTEGLSITGENITGDSSSSITTGGDLHLTAGGVIGSFDPYAPLLVDVGRDLYLSIAQSSGSATGSVGILGVSGTLGGNLVGNYHIEPGSFTKLTNNGFVGNPSGYIFFNQNEIWPNVQGGLPSSSGSGSGVSVPLDSLQVSNVVNSEPAVYYEKQRRHVYRQLERAAPTGILAYHATLDNNLSAIKNFKVEPGAYEFIEGRVANTQAKPALRSDNGRDDNQNSP